MDFEEFRTEQKSFELMAAHLNGSTVNLTADGEPRRLLTRGLVVFQIAITCILLIGSSLQVRSIVNQQTIEYGYDTGGLMSARMGLMEGDYPTKGSCEPAWYDSSSAPRSTRPTASGRVIFLWGSEWRPNSGERRFFLAVCGASVDHLAVPSAPGTGLK